MIVELMLWTLDVLPFVAVVSFGLGVVLLSVGLIMLVVENNAYPTD